jgi:NAD(P)H-flavin reductase
VNPLRPAWAVIREIRTETSDTKTYMLEPEETLTVGGRPGPKPGQFNMIGYPGTGEAPISFSSLPDGSGIVGHTIRAVGLATGFLNRFETGNRVLMRGPFGRGWPMNIPKGKDLVLIAGGVGLAPLRPVILEVIGNREAFGEVSLLIGARDETNLLFASEFDEWSRYLSIMLTVDKVIGKFRRKHEVGLITGLLGKVAIRAGRTVCFVVGPEIMMRFVCRDLMLKALPASSVYVSLERRMKCGIAQCGHCQHVGYFVCKDGPVFSYNEVSGLMDGLL